MRINNKPCLEYRARYWGYRCDGSKTDKILLGMTQSSQERSSSNNEEVWVLWVFLVAQLVKNLPAMQETRFNSQVGKIPWRRDRLLTSVFLGFPGGSFGKESACNAGDLGLIPGLGRPPGRGHDNPLQYSCLEYPCGQRNLVGCSPWGHKESDTTEWLSTVWHSIVASYNPIIKEESLSPLVKVIRKLKNGLEEKALPYEKTQMNRKKKKALDNHYLATIIVTTEMRVDKGCGYSR